MGAIGNEYSELQQYMDQMIGKYGMPKTVKIIRQLSGNFSLKRGRKQRAKLIYTFVVSEAFKVFDVKEKEEKKKLSQSYKDARMACYNLLQLYTDLSYNEIGQQFGHKKFGVYYNIGKCREILSIPKFNKPFVAHYEALEERVIQFIAKIN